MIFEIELVGREGGGLSGFGVGDFDMMFLILLAALCGMLGCRNFRPEK